MQRPYRNTGVSEELVLVLRLGEESRVRFKVSVKVRGRPRAQNNDFFLRQGSNPLKNNKKH